METLQSIFDELPTAVLLLAIALVAGAFFLVKALRMPANFEGNEEKRKKMKRTLMEREEKNKVSSADE